ARSEMDRQVELREVLRPAGLLAGQNLGGSEILKILVVSDHVDGGGGALQVVLPVAEGLKNRQKLLVMGIVVEFGGGKGAGVESDRVEFAVRAGYRKDTHYGVVGGVGFDCDRSVGDPMSEYQSGGEGILEADEGGAAFLGKVGQRHNYFGVVMDEPPIEVSEPKERLNVPDFSWFGPIADGLNLIGGHSQTRQGEDIAEVFDQVPMELALFGLGIQAVAAQAAKYLFYVFMV
ncbi:hypothetical protein PISMIDRAFT_122157, partial [Pisolithus microcarpus 441]